MKKIFLIILILFFIQDANAKINLPFGLKKTDIKKENSLPDNVLAPALQLDSIKYREYFKKSSDYELNLKSRSDYIITCNSDIIGVNWGDVENIKMLDCVDDITKKEDLKSVIMKLKFETYSYIRLYLYNGETVNITINISPVYEADKSQSFGLCKLRPYRGQVGS